MSAQSILLDFSVEPDLLKGKFGSEIIEKNVLAEFAKKFGSENEIQTILPTRDLVLGKPDSGFLSVYMGPKESLITFRSYPSKGLVTINFDYYLENGEPLLLTRNDCKDIEKIWGGKHKRPKTMVPIKRGMAIDRYFFTSDYRLLEYDISHVVYDERSKYQHIQILFSANLGNMLVLDDYINLADKSDLIYTESIMCRGVENYQGKEILILGGGDGALLHELRKENPKNIIMVEIDEMVINACKIHMRAACGDSMDNYKGENYQIIVGDCIDFMEKCFNNGIKFDYVFGDLTDIPISKTSKGTDWDFVRKILNLSFDVLKDDGKYLQHGNGANAPEALKMFEDVLLDLKVEVKFERTVAFIPSFHEEWTFYQIQKKF